MPNSDVDSGVAWDGPPGRADEVAAVADRVLAGLDACGFSSDPHGATAANRLFARSAEDWSRRLHELLAEPGDKHAMILISLACDARVVTGGQWLPDPFELLTALRLDHQAEALRTGRAPSDFIDPRTLNPLARRYLRAAFRAIASIQRRLSNELDFGGPGV
jgi:signal-transduction protein with cAMP-binding, CBS, and nucleotidyltransferase domain